MHDRSRCVEVSSDDDLYDLMAIGIAMGKPAVCMYRGGDGELVIRLTGPVKEGPGVVTPGDIPATTIEYVRRKYGL